MRALPELVEGSNEGVELLFDNYALKQHATLSNKNPTPYSLFPYAIS
jgi:hypothetical protein